MHLKKATAERREIGKEAAGCVSSDSNPNPNPNPNFRFLHHHPQIPQLQSPNQFRPQTAIDSIPESTEYSDHSLAPIRHHLTIEIPSSSSQILISTPHKRPAVAQSQSPRAINVDRFSDKGNRANPNPTSSSFCASCASSLLSILGSIRITTATKQFLQKLIRHVLRARLICFHLRFLLILSIPPIYLFFLLISFRFFLLFVLSVVSLSFILFICLNLAFRHLPSIRLFLARSLPLKLNLNKSSSSSSSKTARKGVVWSIGSKPTSEKKTNSGSWVKKYSNGDVYEGEIHKGKCSGSGVYYYSMKGRYEGDWIDGKYDGYGVETWTKGSRYRGQYRQGMRHGIGVYRFYTGDVYAGEWSNGQCHGCGVYTSEDGSRFVGEFKWGVKHGLGGYHFRNGDTYAGEYFADKMHGFGVYRFANGHRYEGAWHEGRRQGLGMYTFRNGETQAGHWENSVLSRPSEQIIHPGSSFSVSQSKVLDAVQRAREAADKASEVGKVEERVNRAIKAANRAANAARVAAIKAVQKQMIHQDDFK